MSLEQGTHPEGRNLYRRFMSLTRHDRGWVTGPAFFLTVVAPEVAGLTGVVGFSAKAISEIVTTGNLEQAGINALAALGSAALFAGGAYLAIQAELGLEDGRRAEEQERFQERLDRSRIYSPRHLILN